MSAEFCLIIAGGRDYTNYKEFCSVVDKKLAYYIRRGYKITIVSGAAKGTDRMAARYARYHRFTLKEFPPEWNRYGKAAGPKRTEQMHRYAAQFSERGCLLFWDGVSKGTEHNIKYCGELKTKLVIYFYPIQMLL